MKILKKHNFNSGPSILPPEVLQQAAEALINFNGIGLSIAEIGHRSKWFTEVMEEARFLVKKMMNLPSHYEVLFLSGGATTQFMQVPMNLLDTDETAAYCDDGVWGNKAIQEASIFGKVNVAASSKAEKYTCIHKNLSLSGNEKYLHITTNNTVEGTQWHTYPNTSVPLVADMSSDIFSRPINFNQFDLMYAGAQKNIGAAGVTLVVINTHFLQSIKRPIPAIMSYKKHIEAQSLLNTPPVLAVYIALQTLKWIENQGGLVEMEKRNKAKADLLYSTIDSLPLFKTYIQTEDRSLMNAVFFIEDEALQNEFIELCTNEGMIGIKGYRTVGGIRVSMYNALPLQSVQSLCNLMIEFANTKTKN